ncbi:GNAT family N-acetyltransferase [Nocardia sp. NPDC058518]|uniref:GNAT family N-acetyltransferase n=1 Tax=Nocardia sp. NPDC058518 TaxID=3346534 RepID=UPI00364990BB
MTDRIFRRYDAAEARAHRDLVEDVYRRAYSAAIAADDPFESPEAFMTRFDAYTAPDRASRFELVTVTVDNTVVGQTWGWPLGPNSAWWRGLHLDDPDTDHTAFIDESGQRTFALSEIMVDPEYTGQGLAHSLHDELLNARSEERATLLVDPENPAAYTAYRKWGWARAGTLTPDWPDAPTFDVLMFKLGR